MRAIAPRIKNQARRFEQIKTREETCVNRALYIGRNFRPGSCWLQVATSWLIEPVQ